jgi:putative acetyltransferase
VIKVESEFMEVDIREVSPSDQEVCILFKLLDEHNMSYCPPEVCHLTQPDELQNINSVLLGIYTDGILIGMGGLKLYAKYAEVTRMFIMPEFRGNRLAVQLLSKLEAISRNRGYRYLKLETSEKFKSAYQLYLRYGFQLCAPFGEYVNKAHNTYMEKEIAPNKSN